MTAPEPRDPRVDAAYRDAATDAPRAEIDDRIRAAAHRAVAAGPQSLETRAQAEARRSWIARWRVPVSIAATVVVAVTLAYMMEREEIQLARTDGVPAGAPARTPAAPQVAASLPAGVQDEAARPSASADAARLEVELRQRKAEVEAAQKALDQRSAAAERLTAIPEPSRSPAANEPAAPGALSMEREQRQAVGEARPASPAPEPAASAAAPASTIPTAPPPAPAAKLAPLPAREAATAAARDRAFADRPDRMERQAQTAEQKVRTPEEWLEDLRRLKAQQRTEDFARELAEFRKRFPDYKLPADLQQ